MPVKRKEPINFQELFKKALKMSSKKIYDLIRFIIFPGIDLPPQLIPMFTKNLMFYNLDKKAPFLRPFSFLSYVLNESGALYIGKRYVVRVGKNP